MAAVEGLGVFALQQGSRAGFAFTVSRDFTIQEADFQLPAAGSVLLKIDGRIGAATDRFARLSMTATASQARAADGGVLVQVGPGSHAVSARFGWAAPNVAYAIDYRLAGDVDGSYDVTATDLDLIQSGIHTPSALTRAQRDNADVDGNGSIDRRDLQLAGSNLGASTSIRPLRLQAGIGAATPSHEGVVRLASSQIAATTNAGAMVLFVNTATGERARRAAAADGSASVDLRLQPSTVNRIDVSAEDAFGQRAGHRITVHQRPTPVVIVPGWATSGPRNLFDLPEFLMQRGYPADKLAVMGVAKAVVYGDLRTSLAAAGYEKGRDQFLVPYDWRMRIAPDDGVRDGVLSQVTVESILQPQPTFALGYLGTFLKQLVMHDPSIVTVDMLGHSNGGLMARSYIQSLAYGASFTSDGRAYTLPTVDSVILLATPSLGSAISYPLWNNDTSSFTLSLVLADINLMRTFLKPAYYQVVSEGRAVTGPDGIIDRAAITDPVTGQPDPLLFLQRYLASLRDLMPTYGFLRDADGRLTDINNTPSANYLLLDINATSSPGVNPWTALVRQATATFGVHPVGRFTGRPVLTETFVRDVVADGRTGSTWPFQLPKPIVPLAGTRVHVRERLAAGDDMVPAVSLAATYANDPTLVVKPWGNGTRQPHDLSWNATKGSVRHAGFLSNPDVLAFVRRRIAPASQLN